MGKGNRSSKGPAVDNHKGYTVRMMVTSKPGEKGKVATQAHTGKFGIYANKKFLVEIPSKKEGRPTIEKIIAGEVQIPS
jgi:hypothetical protein